MTARLHSIDTTVQKTYEWLKELRTTLHTDDSQVAYQGLRSVLHTLRDRLGVDEAAAFGQQLPMLIRGIYFEGWHPAHKPEKIRNRDEFLQRVAAKFDHGANRDPILLLGAVITLLERHLTEGQLDHVRLVLPEELRALWAEARDHAALSGAPPSP